MATDVDVQYFSHLNGLTLGNNWGDLIRLLDKALVTGIDFTSITAASIDAQGDVHITLYAAHNAMLFQVVELSGFAPASLNQKYRIKGVPSTTELILKPHTAIAETSIVTMGSGKLASLGYEIIFRDTNDVKRVYRAKNPTAQHPFIRVDESLTSPDGTTGVYTSTYAKFAMVGLLEHMDHIDDFENPDVLQLPFDPADPSKNWKITGTGTSALRGWSRWYWARAQSHSSNTADATAQAVGGRAFTLVGSKDAFYFLRSLVANTEANMQNKVLSGCGLFDSALKSDVIQNWFLMTYLEQRPPSQTGSYSNTQGASPLASGSSPSAFYCCHFNETNRLDAQALATPILPDYASGWSGLYSANNVAAMEIPFSDASNYLRGTLKHVLYDGGIHTSLVNTNPILADNSIYVLDRFYANGPSNNGSLFFYLGELE